jgi:prepilin-type N-terminal cleavage/methylation domain-containing protein
MKRGFTLIELAVTLLVLALAVSVAAPSLARGVDTMRVRAETAGVATFLRAARERAITHNRSCEVRVNPDEGVIELRTGETVLAIRRSAPGVRVTLDPPTSRTVTFLPQGLSSGAQILVEGPGRRAYLVTVDPLTGRVGTRKLDT